MDQEPLPMSWVLPSRDVIHLDDVDVLPQIGDGIFTAGVAYRVSDLWLIDDDKTPLPYGWVIFLQEAPEAGNSLLSFNAEYFA